MAAAALRSAARKVCSRGFEGPPSYFTRAASEALKEEHRRVLPRICHVGSTVRRFCSSESSNVLKSNKQGAKPVAKIRDDVLPPPDSPVWNMKVNDLPPDSPLWNIKLGDLPPDSPVWNMKVTVPISPWSPRHPYHKHVVAAWAAGTLALCSAIVYVETNYIFKRPTLEVDNIIKLRASFGPV